MNRRRTLLSLARTASPRAILGAVAVTIGASGLGAGGALAAPPASIEAFRSQTAFDAKVRITETVAFDDVPTGTSYGHPAVVGPARLSHSSAASWQTLGLPAYAPPTAPHVLAPFNAAPDTALAFGETTVTLEKGTKAFGMWLVIPSGHNASVFMTTTVTATNVRGDVLEVPVTFQAAVGDQQFVGFTSRSPLTTVTFDVATWSGGSAVVAVDDLAFGK